MGIDEFDIDTERHAFTDEEAADRCLELLMMKLGKYNFDQMWRLFQREYQKSDPGTDLADKTVCVFFDYDRYHLLYREAKLALYAALNIANENEKEDVAIYMYILNNLDRLLGSILLANQYDDLLVLTIRGDLFARIKLIMG